MAARLKFDVSEIWTVLVVLARAAVVDIGARVLNQRLTGCSLPAPVCRDVARPLGAAAPVVADSAPTRSGPRAARPAF